MTDHQKWLAKRGLLPEQIRLRKKPNSKWKQEYSASLKVDRSTAHYDNKGFSASPCTDKGIMANLHKESDEVRKAVIEKAKRTAPLYNKGGYMLITEGTDLSTVGKKV